MPLRISLLNLYAAPGFFDATGDLAPSMSEERALAMYSFLPAGTSFQLTDDDLLVVCPEPGKKRRSDAAELFERASRRAREGDHDKAIKLYETGLAIDVLHTTARRDLAMSRMAKRDSPGADAELRRLLLLAPTDAWAWVILGNLNFRKNFALAERYFKRAIELSPTDSYAWNGMGIMYSEKRDFPRAVAAFETALKEQPKFANAHFGLAAALADSGETRKAFNTLERMFATCVVQDSRALSTFEQAGRYYRELAQRLASETIEAAETDVEALRQEAERLSGFPVTFEDGDFGKRITASTEMAWKHGRDHHVIRVRESIDPTIRLHLHAHELCHIIMEAEARNAGSNRWFSTNETGFALAQKELANEMGSIRRTLAPEAGEQLIEQLFKGLMAQLYNLPLDMLIEQRIATRHPSLRYAQIQSISLLLEEAIKGCSAPDIVNLVPRRVLYASRFLNACYAAFVDQQNSGALAASLPYIQMGAMERGLKLFKIWQVETQDLSPGGEYNLVDAFATDLRLEKWFAWITDTGEMPPAPGPEGTTNPELLAIKSPAAVFYFLDVLKRFDAMDPETIKRVGVEAAVTGRAGLNYGSPDKTYHLPLYGPEALSGLEVMCVMFAAFQRVAPQHDIGIKLHDAYEKALAMHEERKDGAE